MQDEATHTVAERWTSSETTGEKPNQANQDSNKSFPKHSGGHEKLT